MNSLSKDNFLIANSEGESILFQLGVNSEIKYTFLDQEYKPIEVNKLFENNVLKYSVTIDNSNRIHLTHISKSGQLNYSIYENKNWSTTTIAKFDLRSRIYNNIFILSHEESIHIIYAYANLINSKLWNIHHISGNRGNFKHRNVTKFASERSSILFSIDMDLSNSIQLLYRSKVNDADLLYSTFYNSFTEQWNPVPQKVNTSNSFKEFPYILSDTKNNIHSLWLEKFNTNFVLKYSRFTSSGSNKYRWNEIKIPYIDNCNNNPIIIEEGGILKIIYPVENGIGNLYSLDYGITWEKGEIINIETNKLNLIHVVEAVSKLKNTKINDVYCYIEGKINFLFINNSSSSNLISTEDNLIDLSNKVEESIHKPDNSEQTDQKMGKLLEAQEEIKDALVKILNSQDKMKEDIEKIIQMLNTRKESIFDKFMK